MKTKLNKYQREILFCFSKKKIDYPQQAQNEYLKIFNKEIKIIEEEALKAYPQDHMRILKIYEFAKEDRCLKIRQQEDSPWFYISISIPKEKKWILTPTCNHCKSHWLGEKSYQAAEQINIAYNSREEDKNKVLDDYRKLIYGCKTFEELCDYWPEAKELDGQIINKAQLPATINKELISRIQSNLKERTVQSE